MDGHDMNGGDNKDMYIAQELMQKLGERFADGPPTAADMPEVISFVVDFLSKKGLDQRDIQELEDKLKAVETPEQLSMVLSEMMMEASGQQMNPIDKLMMEL